MDTILTETEVTVKTTKVSGAASFTLKNFLAEVRTAGLSRPNRFEILIQPPSVIAGPDSQLVSLMADATLLPGKRILTGRQQLFGPPEFFPVGVDYGGDSLNITFIVDRQLRTKLFFDGWMDQVVTPTQSNNNIWHTTRYRSDYIGRIVINQLDESDSVVYSVTVFDVFPIAINPMQMDNNLTGTIHKLNITFNYRYWDTNQIAPNTKANSSIWNDIFGIFGSKSITDPGSPTLPTVDRNTNRFTLTPQQQAQNILQPGSNTPGGEYFLVK
jgi:hypothetical protein